MTDMPKASKDFGQELSDFLKDLTLQLTNFNFDEAWTTAEQLHKLLSSREEKIYLTAQERQAILRELDKCSYYTVNRELKALRQQLLVR